MVDGDDADSTTLPPRLVVLGASNVAMGLRKIVKIARQELNGPVDFHFAYAHGRSYGFQSNIGWWTYPSILDCDLWTAIESDTPTRSFGLITDIGNDILYGAEPDQIANWVREVSHRLRDCCQHLAITQLPLESVRELDSVRFHVMKAILFPKCRMNLKEVLSRACRLNSLLNDISSDSRITSLKPKREWYGLDPIHFRHAEKERAWGNYIRNVTRHSKTQVETEKPEKLGVFRNVRPARWQSFGRQYRADQPTICMPDGSRLFRY
jgi:hypothetical protein